MSQGRTSTRPQRTGRLGFLVVLMVAGVGILLLRNTLFVVRQVTVEGNHLYSANQVVAISGINAGQNVFNLSEADIKRRMDTDRYLVFDSMYINYPDHVILRVHERTPQAAVSWLGVWIMLDERGMVQETTNALNALLQVPVVTGMDVLQYDVGYLMQTRNPQQMTAMHTVLEELTLQGFTLHVAELNVSNLGNLYLVTQEGMKIELGDAAQMEMKLGIARAVYAQLEADGSLTGTIDVASGTYADYQQKRVYNSEFLPDPTLQPRVTATPRPL